MKTFPHFSNVAEKLFFFFFLKPVYPFQRIIAVFHNLGRSGQADSHSCGECCEQSKIAGVANLFSICKASAYPVLYE